MAPPRAPEVLAAVRGIIRERLRANTVIADAAPLYSSGLLDSMSIVDLLTELETRFDISIPGGEVLPDDFDSVEKIARTVERFLGAS